MKTLEKYDVRTLKLDKIQLEVESTGRNEYRFKRRQFEHHTDELGIFFDLEVYADSEGITDIVIKNINVYSDFGPIELEPSEHEHIHDQISNSLTVTTWN